MKSTSAVFASLVCCGLACSSDEGPGGGTGAAGEGGGLGTTTSTSVATSGGVVSTSAGAGGGQGGQALGGGGQGGALGAIGDPCEGPEDCQSDFCFDEATYLIAGGVCSVPCPNDECPDGYRCTGFLQGYGCLPTCPADQPDTCPERLTCVVSGPYGICRPLCDEDNECTVPGNVCNQGWDCRPAEVCDNGVDDNFDSNLDCADSTCFDDPGCEAACQPASPIVGGIAAGDTSSGANGFALSCQSGNDGSELIYTYTPPANGYLTVTLQSPTSHAITVRTECHDKYSSILCASGDASGTNETRVRTVLGGQQLVLLVEAALGAEGPFTIALDFEAAPPEVCDNGADEDVDELVDCADPDCQGTPACAPGSASLGEPCDAHADCGSVTGGDPLCIRAGQDGYDANFCSEWCEAEAGACGPGGYCWQSQCFLSCESDLDCPAGFACGYPWSCLPLPPVAWACDPMFYADFVCDCGCGAVDPDCADASVGSCLVCNLPGSCSAGACPGTIDPGNNAVCL